MQQVARWDGSARRTCISGLGIYACDGEGSYAATWQVTVHRYDQFPSFYPQAHMLIRQIEQYRHYTTKASFSTKKKIGPPETGVSFR
jgi:hypothetical protein